MWFRRCLLSGCLILLAGCNMVIPRSEEPMSFKEAMATRNYRAANEALKKIEAEKGPGAAVYQRQWLSERVASEQGRLLVRVNKLVANKHWDQALELLASAQRTLPDSPMLQRKAEAVRKARADEVLQLELALQKLRAKQLPPYIRLLEQIAEASENGKGDWRLKQARQEGYELADELLGCVEESLRRDDIPRARGCLEPIAPIARPEVKSQVIAANRLLQTASEVASKPTGRRSDAGLQFRLRREYQDAVSAGWWQSAQDKLRALERGFPNDKNLPAWRKDLNKKIDRYVESQIKYGQKRYSRGDIVQALNIWREAAKLDPDNRVLQSHIERAEKFLAKLHQLEK